MSLFYLSAIDACRRFKNNLAAGDRLVPCFQITVMGSFIAGVIGLKVRPEPFETFVEENFFDLHYDAKPGATPINLGNGNLWRLAVDHPFQEVLACIHRDKKEKNGEYRLLLIC